MIKLKELLHTVNQENEKDLVTTDSWTIPDADYLMDMGFKQDGMYTFYLKRPTMQVTYKKGEGFKLKDKSKKSEQIFPKFSDLVIHFENYQQDWEDAPYV